MKLITERLILRELSVKDAKSLAEQGNDKDIHLFTWYIPHPFTIEESKKLINARLEDRKKEKRKFYELAILEKETKNLIGLVSIYDLDLENKKAKLGYWLGKSHRGKGYASEAVREMTNLAFNKLKINKLQATTLSTNEKSSKFLEKFKFKNTGMRKKDRFLDNKHWDVNLWELLR